MTPQDIIEQAERQSKFDLVLEAMEEIQLNQKNKKVDRVNAIFILESILNEWEDQIPTIANESRKSKLKDKLRQLYYIHDTWSEILTAEVYARKKSKLLENKCNKLEKENYELKLLVDKLSKQIEFNE
jgi:hypothetical protein